jgi:hypothetical protein
MSLVVVVLNLVEILFKTSNSDSENNVGLKGLSFLAINCSPV